MVDITHIKPDPKLSKYVRNISVFSSKERIKYRHKLTPSAYTYISYNHLDIPKSIFGKKQIQPIRRLQIAGPKLSGEIFVEYDGNLSQILIEFTASGFYYLFHISPTKLVNNLVDLSNYSSLKTSDNLERKLLEKNEVDEQIKIMENFLLEKVSSARPFACYIEEALKIFEKHKGNLPVNSILGKIGISERQFDRKFNDVVGVGPKCYSKLLQLHYVIKLMQSKEYESIQDIAYKAEYYDASHFSNKFKELTGFSPADFILSNEHLALKYFTN